MINQKKLLLDQYLEEHYKKISSYIMRISGVFLAISTIWNLFFIYYEVEFSRAKIGLLGIGLALWVVVAIYTRINSLLSYKGKRHVLFIFLLFLITLMYFGSGYHEAWSYFLLIPLAAGLYGDKQFLTAYSCSGALLLTGCSFFFPVELRNLDYIDLSNRLLLYIIISSLSLLLLRLFFNFFSKQVDITVESTENTLEQIVNSFIVAIEAKDTYTFGHSERVSKYAVELARVIPGFKDESTLKQIKLMGLIHDIGKIHIPEHVLTKPSALSHSEFEIIKSHTTQGAKMIEKIEGLSSLKNAVLYHHERWDGKGYPTNRKGDDIPMEARILAVADAFDAMTSTRAYREAVEVKEAFRRLEEGKATQFDPFIIDQLESVRLRWMSIHKNSQDVLEEFERITDLF